MLWLRVCLLDHLSLSRPSSSQPDDDGRPPQMDRIYVQSTTAEAFTYFFLDHTHNRVMGMDCECLGFGTSNLENGLLLGTAYCTALIV